MTNFSRPQLAACLVLCSIGSIASAEALPDRTTTIYADHLEWALTNPSHKGNPFDLEATATFTHTGDGGKITTPIFYAGKGTWKFRFTATRAGRWTFATRSSDSDLSGWTGQVTVTRTEQGVGFIIPHGTKWARHTVDGPEAMLPQYVMYEARPKNFASARKVKADIETFLVKHGFTGFHVPSLGGYWFNYDNPNDKVSRDMTNPDPRTFDALEGLIIATHRAGGAVHIWAWGDNSRRQTSDSLTGGEAGRVAQRLERYIAARLGPLPGWTMGYGYDLDEWTTSDNVRRWAESINGMSGWNHLLGGRPEGPNHGTDHSADARWNTHLPYASYEHHKPDYDAYAAALNASVADKPLNKPVFSEDRFRIRAGGRHKDYTAQQTRRGLWTATMAGGVANIWGNLSPRGHDSHDRGSAPYDNTRQIKTWSVFFNDKKRFTLDMRRANDLTAGDARALADPKRGRIVIYKEDATSIALKLAGPSGTYDVIAVDAARPYAEIPLAAASGDTSVTLPRKSDWALALRARAPSRQSQDK
jgi:hypothetical protein